jgi:hypothetical protein
LKIVRENKQIRDWGKKDGGGKIKKFQKKPNALLSTSREAQ